VNFVRRYFKWTIEVPKTTIFIALLFIANCLNSQTLVDAKLLYGKMVPHSTYTETLAATVSGIQLDADWEIPIERRPIYQKRKKYYNQPHVGVSLLAMDMGLATTGSQYGMAVSVGGIRSFSDNFGVRWRLAHGISYLTEKYNLNKEPVNYAIGSNFNYLLVLTGEFRFKFSNYLGINGGFNLTHCSNANYKKPNVGLNAINGSLGLSYFPHSNRTEGKRLYRLKHKYFAYPYSLGVKLAIREHSIEFPQPTAIWIFDFNYRLQKNSKGYWDYGIELFSDPNYYWDQYGNLYGVSAKDTREVALKIGKVFLYGRLGLRFDLGYYALKPVHSDKPVFYNGLGCDYRLTQNWILRNRIKAHLNKADFMEWGLSYIW
jgi:hypothetical protein